MRTYYTKKDLGKVFLLAFGLMVLSSVIISAILLVLGFAGENNSSVVIWITLALSTLAIGATAPIYGAATKTKFIEASTINKAPRMAHAGWGCLATLFLVAFSIPVNAGLMWIIQKCGFPEAGVELPMEIVPMIIFAAIFPAVTEEWVFRGTLANCLKNNKNRYVTLVVSGALFALFHTNPAQTIHQFILGALLTLLALRSGSMWTSSIVHLFNNIIAIVLTFVVKDEDAILHYWYILVPVGLLGFVASCYGYLKTTKSYWQIDEEADVKMDNLSIAVLVVGVVLCAALWITTLILG